MRVYRRAEKILKRGSAFLTPPTAPMRSVEVVSGVSMSTLSKKVTSPPSPPVLSPPKMAKRTCWPATAIKARHTKKLHKKQQYNKAFKKHAALAYEREKAKGRESGMSARMMTEIVWNEFKVNLYPRTI